MKNSLLFILLLFPSFMPAQGNLLPLNNLDTVFISNNNHYFLPIDSVYIIPDSIFHTALSIGEILFAHTALTLRMYGRGMVSGISMRGSSSAHVQVLWQGMPLNSPLTGQFDINMLAPVFDKLEIIKGGKAVFYGSGSMGGNIHLANPVIFEKGQKIHISLTGGQTRMINPIMRTIFSGKYHYFHFSFSYLDDKNIYSIPSKNYENPNARILSGNILADYAFRTGQWLTSFHFFHSHSIRNLPPTLTTISDNKLALSNENFAAKTQYKATHFQWNLTAGLQKGKYFYYIHHDDPLPAGKGFSKIFYLKTSFHNKIHPSLQWYIEAEEKIINGYTNNYTRRIQQNPVISSGIDYRKKNWQWAWAIRKNFNPQFKLPPTFSFLSQYHLKSLHQLLFTVNTTLRLPAFNDLYWHPGGNPDLDFEKGIEWEFAHTFNGKYFYAQTTIFYKYTKDLIKWLPQSNGLWTPRNIEKVTAKGIEWAWKYTQRIYGVTASLSSESIYQQVINLRSKKQLIYTPTITSFIQAEMQYHLFRLFYSFRFQDLYYTDPEHFSFIKGHWLHNAGIGIGNSRYRFEVYVKNLFNQYYQLTPSYPMPGREIRWKISLILKKNKYYEKQNL